MAKSGRASRGTPPRRRQVARPSGAKHAPKKKPASPARSPQKVIFDAPVVEEQPRVFRLGAVAGATPGKWIDAWKTRMPRVPLELVPVEAREQRAAIGAVDAAIVRLPLDDVDELHVIPLYDEVPVVVASVDSHLMAATELTADDLAGEVLITPLDDVLGPLALPTVTPAFAPPATTADAIATVATGVGIVVVPMSLARLHHRKDVDYRPLVDGPVSPVALTWRREATTDDIETFIGIVRGRTANSSR